MIPIAMILTRIADEGMSVREVASEYRLAVPLARALWEAEVLGAGNPREMPVCSACVGSGAKDGAPCKACRGSGMGAAK